MGRLKSIAKGEWLIAVSATALIVMSFRPWLRFQVVGLDGRRFGEYVRNGWQEPSGYTSLLAILIGFAMGTAVIVKLLRALDLPEDLWGIGWGRAYLAGGVLAFVLVLLKWLGHAGNAETGLYLGLVSTAGLAAGGLLTAKERGELPSGWSVRRPRRKAPRAQPPAGPAPAGPVATTTGKPLTARPPARGLTWSSARSDPPGWGPAASGELTGVAADRRRGAAGSGSHGSAAPATTRRRRLLGRGRARRS